MTSPKLHFSRVAEGVCPGCGGYTCGRYRCDQCRRANRDSQRRRRALLATEKPMYCELCMSTRHRYADCPINPDSYVETIKNAMKKTARNQERMGTDEELRAAVDRSTTRYIELVIGPRQGPSHRVRLLPRAGPIGDLITVNCDGDCVASFDRRALRRWLARRAQA